MAYIGHPLVGDSLYGKKSEFIDRQALHSYKLEFIHPISNKKIELKSDIPQDFMNVLNI